MRVPFVNVVPPEGRALPRAFFLGISPWTFFFQSAALVWEPILVQWHGTGMGPFGAGAGFFSEGP